MTSNNKCAACGQWAGRGHRCPTPSAIPTPAHPDAAPTVTPTAPIVDAAAVTDRVNRAHAALAAPIAPALPTVHVADVRSDEAAILAWESAGATTSDAQAIVDAQKLQAEQFDRQAQQHRQAERDSFERSDTDGFVSQWASNVTAREQAMRADIARAGGVHHFPVLVRDGQLVPARLVETKYGTKWAVFASAEEANAPRGEILEWVPADTSKLARKGYALADQVRPARVLLGGNTAVNVRPYPAPDDNMRFNPDAPVALRPTDE